MTPAGEIVREILKKIEEGENPNLQPSILMNRNINPEHVVEMTLCNVNQHTVEELKALIESGFALFRVQTELKSTGHYTVAYLAKLKPGEPEPTSGDQ